MFNYVMKSGSTSQSVVLRVIDSTTGVPITTAVFNSAGIDIQYRREGAASTAITEVTLAALTTAYSAGGFLHIGNGYYRFDVPDAALATGVSGVLVHGTITGMVVIGAYVQLVAYDPFDVVRLGLTALPNAAAEAAGGLYTRGTGAGQLNQTANGRLDANTISVSGTTQTARDLGASVLLSSGTGTGQLDFTSGVVKANLAQILGTALTETAGQLAAAFKKFFDKAAPTGTINSIPDVVAGAAGGLFIAGTNAATTVTTSLTTTFTGNLTGSVASVTGAVGSVTGAVGSVTAPVTLGTLDTPVAHSGTAQAGGASTITLAAGASATDNFYNGMLIKLYGGTGIAQTRMVLSYVGATKVATIDRAWVANPDSTSTYGLLWSSTPKLDTSLQVTAASVQGNVTGSVASVTGAVGSVTGAVGSVTGNVGGNVVGSVASVTGAVGSVTGAVASVTGNVGGNVTGSVGSLAAQAQTDVKTQVVAALVTDTYSEPGQGAPGVNVSLKDKIGYLYKFMRNKVTQTSTTLSIFADDASTVDQKSTVSDDGTVYTRNEVASGP